MSLFQNCKMSEETIKVAVRIRPLIKKENDRGYRSVISKVAPRPQVSVKTGKATDYFTFDYVFDGEESQEVVYEHSIKSMVKKLFKGSLEFKIKQEKKLKKL